MSENRRGRRWRAKGQGLNKKRRRAKPNELVLVEKNKADREIGTAGIGV